MDGVDRSEWDAEKLVDWLWERMMDALDGFGGTVLALSGVRRDARAAVGGDSPVDWDGHWDLNYEAMRIGDAADAALDAVRIGVLAAKKILEVD